MQFKNQLAVVTGAGSGLGRGISEILLERGARVALIDLDSSSLTSTSEVLEPYSENIRSYQSDVTDIDQFELTINKIESEFGPVEILVNGAGVIAAQGFEDTYSSRLEDWDATYSVNLKGTVIACHTVSEKMKSRSKGKIVNIASHAGRRGSSGNSAYGASKAAVIHLTQSLAAELAPNNINVNVICPGSIWTPMWELIAERNRRTNPEMSHLSGREIFDKFIQERCPLKREQTAEDIGKGVAFFASDDACNITGQSLNINGGTRMD